MKRRNFVRNAALGAISLGIFTPDLIASPFTFQGSSIAPRWLGQLGGALCGNRRFKARIAPESFAQLTLVTNDYFAQRGYRSENDAFHFFGDQEAWCFYPLHFRHAASGVSDFVVPVLHRESDNNWHLVKTLSGFQIEALLKVSQELPGKTTESLQNLLIPVEKDIKGQWGQAYKTRDGMVTVKTFINGGKAETTCTITGREGMVFNKTFSSRHSLNV
ncbi:MAG: hypothetical protein ACKVU0_13140 [Saprospiraceae bacterium]